MPTPQDNVAVSIIYGAETTFGVQSVAAGKAYPRVRSSLVPNKDSFQSALVRSDNELTDARHGLRRPGGSLESEIMLQAQDDFLEACLRGTWANGVSLSQSDFTSLAAVNSTSKFSAASGDFLALGLKVGDIFRLTGASVAGNNGVNYRITAINGTSNRDLTVTPAPTDMSADTTIALAVQGKKLTTGLVQRSFTVEQRFPDTDMSQLFLGCRIGSGRFSLPPNGMATVAWDIMGQDFSIKGAANSPVFASPAAEPNTSVLSGLNGALILNGTTSVDVTGVDFTFTNNLSQPPVLGRNTAPQIFYGRKIVSGNVSVYLEDTSLLDLFTAETEVDLIAVMEAAGAAPVDFLSFRFHRIKLMGLQQTIEAEGGVVGTFAWQALLKSGGAGTAYDQASMVVQRSN